MSKKKKIIILSVMVVLLGVTGFLNIMLNNNLTSVNVNNSATESFYTNFRANRDSARKSEISLYESIIASEKSTQTEIANAQEAKNALIAQIEKEVVIEGLIEAKLQTDAVYTESNNYVNVVVNRSEKDLTAEQVSQIKDIILKQTKVPIDNIAIMPSAE